MSKTNQGHFQDTLDELLNLVRPIIEFDQAMESSRQDDLQLIWDIRIVRGKDTSFLRNKGSSTLPQAMAPGMMFTTPDRIQTELTGKIVTPLVMKAHHIIQPLAAESLSLLGDDSALHGKDGGELPKQEATGQETADHKSQGK